MVASFDLSKYVSPPDRWFDISESELNTKFYRKQCDIAVIRDNVTNQMHHPLHPWFGSYEFGYMLGAIDMWAAVVLHRDSNGVPQHVFRATDSFYFKGLQLGASYIGDEAMLRIVRIVDDLVALDGLASVGEASPVSVALVDAICKREFGDAEGKHSILSLCMFEYLIHVYLGMGAEEHKQWVNESGILTRTSAHRAHKLYAIVRLLIDHEPLYVVVNECCNQGPYVPVDGLAKRNIVQISVGSSGYMSKYDDWRRYPVWDKRCKAVVMLH